MNPILSLQASAEAYLVCGLISSANTCLKLADSCREMCEQLGADIGSSLYRHFATEQAIRATQKLAAFNQRRAA